MQTAGKRSLEKLRIFPYVAWGLIILFAVVVYHLASEVSVATKRLQMAQTESLQTLQTFEQLSNKDSK